MMLVLLVLGPIVVGLFIWCVGDRRVATRRLLALAGSAIGLIAAVASVVQAPQVEIRWGAGLTLTFEVAAIARAPIVLVPVVGTAVIVYALDYGDERGRSRMVGLLLAFVGTMELLLLAGDLLSLLIAWELVGFMSWGLIAHHWRTDGPQNAARAFLVTHIGDLGLFLSAGAAFLAVGSLQFAALGGIGARPGWAPHVLVAGILVAAFSKSAQLPFSPWLFSAMAGPTPASALLHSATMVAAGAYLLARLSPELASVAWFAPVAIGVGLATALVGGVVAIVQPEAKKLLAASTSAHYGFMIVAVGAGYPAVAIAHLIAHGLFKALLFISAGVAIDASGSTRFDAMRIGGSHRTTAVLTAIGALALAAVPPLGAAWTKEAVVSAAAHDGVWIALLVIVAGAFSALYATRFQLLAYGRSTGTAPADDVDTGHARISLGVLALGSVALSVLWLPWGRKLLLDITGGTLPASEPWEFIASVATVAVGIAVAVMLSQRDRLLTPWPSAPVWAVEWFGIARTTRVAIVDPVLALARQAARFDDRIVDAGVRGVGGLAARASGGLATFDDRVVDFGIRSVAVVGERSASLLDRVVEFGFDRAVHRITGGIGGLGRRSRQIQSGQTHQYYALIAVAAFVLVITVAVWR